MEIGSNIRYGKSNLFEGKKFVEFYFLLRERLSLENRIIDLKCDSFSRLEGEILIREYIEVKEGSVRSLVFSILVLEYCVFENKCF